MLTALCDPLLMNENDEVIGEEADLLSNALDLALEDIPPLVEAFDGICFPAHVDREANGIISTLGTFPEFPPFEWAEFHDAEKINSYKECYPLLQRVGTVIGSDAHYLWDIRDKEHFFELDDEPYSSDFVRKKLFQILKGETE